MRETMVFLIQICFQRQVCAIIHYQDGVSNSMLVLLADDVRRVATQRKGTFGFNYRSRDVLQIRATFCGCSQDPFSLRRRWISCQIGESGVLLQRSGSCVGGAFVAFPPAFQTHAFQSPKSKLQNDKNGCGELARRGCFARSWPEHIQNICFNYISPTWPFCTIDRVALFLCCPERLADRGDLSIHVRVFLTRAIDIFGAQLFGSPPIVFFSFSSSTVELGP